MSELRVLDDATLLQVHRGSPIDETAAELGRRLRFEAAWSGQWRAGPADFRHAPHYILRWKTKRCRVLNAT